jgi:hypothetical protein
MPDGRTGLAEHPPKNPLCHRVWWDDGLDGTITAAQFEAASKAGLGDKRAWPASGVGR